MLRSYQFVLNHLLDVILSLAKDSLVFFSSLQSDRMGWITTLPWQTNLVRGPIEDIINENDKDTGRRLARNWREAVLAEQNFVALTVRTIQ